MPGLLPLTLSAHPSAWTADAANEGGRQEPRAVSRGRHSCQFCGHLLAGWRELFHLSGDHVDDRLANLADACPLCHLVQHLNRPCIEDEAVLVWLPEMRQSALNSVVRAAHLVLHAHGEPASLDRRPRAETEPVFAAYAAFKALEGRTEAAGARLGTTSPRQLGAALLALSPAAYAARAERLGGVRLLPRGRLFRAGTDVYPELLAAWATPTEGQPA